jgi:hypothetical protein
MVGLRDTTRVSPALGRMFMARPYRRALAFLGSGFGRLLAAHRKSARWPITLHYRLASLQGRIGVEPAVPDGETATVAVWRDLWPR